MTFFFLDIYYSKWSVDGGRRGVNAYLEIFNYFPDNKKMEALNHYYRHNNI